MSDTTQSDPRQSDTTQSDPRQSLCTLFHGVLVQKTALLVGGEALASSFDHSFARDGMGRATLSGRGLAGALIASARKLGLELPAYITGAHAENTENGEKPENCKHQPSAWRTYNSHPCATTPPQLEPRIHVAIRQDTGAAAEGKLFDEEVIARGVRWPFLLEVSRRYCASEDEYQKAVDIAREALLEWQAGRLWLGMGVAGGLGWMALAQLRAVQLNHAHKTLWPNNTLAADLDARFEYAQKLGGASPLAITAATERLEKAWHYQHYDLEIECGQPPASGYGLDALCVGGFENPGRPASLYQGKINKPRGMQQAQFDEEFKPDHGIVLTRNAQGVAGPIIPGTALRGPLRHALSHLINSNGAAPLIFDPAAADKSEQPADAVGELFGHLEARDANAKLAHPSISSAILISDAHLVGHEWRADWLQHHAEDEFTQSTYASAKFDRVVLTQGHFKAELVIEAKDAKTLEIYVTQFESLLPQLTAGHIPIGGGNWGGVGWLAWKVTKLPANSAQEQTA